MSNDEEAIKTAMATFAEGWNNHDMKLLASVFAEDGDFVSVMALWWRGRDEIEQNHAQAHATVLRESHLTIIDTQIRFLKPDVAIVHSHWEITGQLSPEDEKLPPRKGLLTQVSTSQDNKWLIAALQNTEGVPSIVAYGLHLSE